MSGKSHFLTSKPAITVGGIVIICLIGLGFFGLIGTTHFFHKTPTMPAATHSTANSQTKGEPQSQPTSPSSSGTATVPPAQAGSSKSSANSSVSLAIPTGTFVSNHRPNLSGSPAPNEMQSSCTTTPGATCQIIFSKDGITKSLDTRMTDSNGAAYWSWKLQDIGLTQGTWQVEAVATLNNQSKSAYDSLDLEVGP